VKSARDQADQAPDARAGPGGNAPLTRDRQQHCREALGRSGRGPCRTRFGRLGVLDTDDGQTAQQRRVTRPLRIPRDALSPALSGIFRYRLGSPDMALYANWPRVPSAWGLVFGSCRPVNRLNLALPNRRSRRRMARRDGPPADIRRRVCAEGQAGARPCRARRSAV
jgi:hypothetical protein